MEKLKQQITNEILMKIKKNEKVSPWEIRAKLEAIPRTVLRKNWNAIEEVLSDPEKARDFIIQVFQADEAYRANPRKFMDWVLANIKVIYDEVYDYTWGDYDG